ncbi:MAG: ROK family protein [Hyphomonas sp.]|nr:ROK family protein [Hyphomonas sp.]
MAPVAPAADPCKLAPGAIRRIVDMLGAIEAGGTKIVCAAGPVPGQIHARETFRTAAPTETFQQIQAFFGPYAESGQLEALGLAAFGPVGIAPGAPGYGQVQKTPKPGWTGVDWLDGLAPLACPVALDTDVNAAALGEQALGAGQGCQTLAYVTVGTGIGAGVIHQGRAPSGTGHYEMGHIYPPRSLGDVFEGLCPYHGDCLEGLASGPAIAARWGTDLSSLLADHPAHALEAAYLAQLAVTITLTHMPERIVFGGGVMKTPGLIDRVRAETRRLLGGYVSQGPASGDLGGYIVPPGLGEDSGITGALILASRA